LHLIGVARFQILPLCLGLHALGNGGQPQALGHRDDGIHRRRIAAALGIDVAHEHTVDLQRIDRELAQVRQ
jgi:hypothetical protein